MRSVPLLAAVALVPLIITPGVLFYYDVTPKIAVLFLGAALTLLLSRIDLGLLWLHRPARWFLGIVALQWIWFALATALSSDRSLSLNGASWRRDGLITQTGLLAFTLLCLEWLLENPANLSRLRQVIAGVGVLISIYTIFQYFGMDPFLPAKAYQAGEGPFTIVRPPGTLGHADYLACWLLFAIFCSPVWTLPLTLFALLLTGARSALVGLVVGGIVIFLSSRVRQRVVLAAAGLALLLAVFVLSPAGAKLRARVHWSVDDARGGARLLLWRDTLPMIAQHPLIGWGPETFGAQFPLHESLDLARAYPDFYHESPHNLLLDLTVGQGLPALLAFLALCVIAFRSGVRSPSLLAGLAALLAAHLFVVFTVPVELALYLLMAMLVSLDAPPRQAAPGGTVVAQYALAALFLVLTVRLVVPDALLARAQRQIANGDVAAAAGAYHASLRWQPSGSGADLAYSRQMAVLAATSPVFRTRLDALQQAFESGIRATGHSDQRQNAWYNLAELFAAQNDARSTERSLRNAIAWSPNWFKPHYILAQLLESQHRLSEALMEAQAAVERDGGRDPEVANTLMRVRRAASEP